MKFAAPLVEGVLIKRYKRFLADVTLESGEVITAHTPNTGSMSGCCEPGSPVWLLHHDNPKRKYAHSWELVQNKNGIKIGINTSLANKLVQEAIESGVAGELSGYQVIRREVKYGLENSRIDLLLEGHKNKPDCYVEVKNVTLCEQGKGMFPDAVSKRGTKHLRELMEMKRAGFRSVIFFCIQRQDVTSMSAATHIDPEYAETLQQAHRQGVEILAYRASPNPENIELRKQVPVRV
jgi:sugar fermentation stimulation protein A